MVFELASLQSLWPNTNYLELLLRVFLFPLDPIKPMLIITPQFNMSFLAASSKILISLSLLSYFFELLNVQHVVLWLI